MVAERGHGKMCAYEPTTKSAGSEVDRHAQYTLMRPFSSPSPLTEHHVLLGSERLRKRWRGTPCWVIDRRQ